MAYRALALAAAVRVVVGVHDGTAHGGTGAEVTGFARLAEVHNLVLEVAYLAHGSLAFYGDEPHFARGHFEGCVCALFCHYLGGDACGPRYLRAAAGLQLYRVNDGTYGDIRKGKRVAGLDVGAAARYHLIAYLKAYGSEDMPLFAVGVCKKGDVRRTVGVVLNGLTRRGDAVCV